MRAANEIRVGIVVVAALALIVAGYFFLRGIGLGADLYYVRLDEAANISAGNDVRLQGVRIGQVQEVTLDPVTQKPLLTLAIRREKQPFKLLRSYRYSVQSSGIIGEQYVDIRGPYRDDPSLVYAANDPSQIIPGTTSSGLAGISDQATELIADFRTTLRKFNVTIDRVNNGVLSYNNQVRLARAIEGVTRMTEQVGQSFGPGGAKIALGDPRSQRALNATLENSAVAAREASIAARNIRTITQDAGRDVRLLTRDASRDIRSLTRDMRSIVSENRGQLRGILTNLNSTSQNIAGVTETVNFLVREGGFKENTQLAFQSLRRAAENVEATTASFKALSGDPAIQQNVSGTLTALREATESLRDTTQSIRTLLADAEVQGQLKGTLASLNRTASTLEATTGNLRDAAAGIKNVIGDPQLQTDLKTTAAEMRGTLTAVRQSAEGLRNVLGDPQVQSDLKGTVSELRGTLAATRAAAERINRVLGGRRGGSQTTGSPDGRATRDRSSASSGFDFTSRRFTDFGGHPRTGSDVSGRNYGDLTFNGHIFRRPLRFGLANIGEGTDVTLQTGTPLGRSGLVRYGLYRSKLGLGADYSLGRFSLEANAWDPNNRSYNGYIGFRITPQVEILAGREHIGGVRTNALGVRLRP